MNLTCLSSRRPEGRRRKIRRRRLSRYPPGSQQTWLQRSIRVRAACPIKWANYRRRRRNRAITLPDRIQSLLKRGLARDLLIGLGLKGAGAVASFGLNLLISRAMGADGVGIFQIALATATLLAVASNIGLDTIVLRSVATAWRRQDLGMARVAILRALRVVSALGTGIGLAMALLAWPMAHLLMGQPDLHFPIVIMALAVPAIAMVRTISASIRATGNVLLSQSLDGISYTGLALMTLGGVWLWREGLPPLAPELAYAGACTLVMLFALTRIRKLIQGWPDGEQTLSIRAGLRIMAIYLAAYFCDWIAVVALGTWHSPAEAGIYRVAMQFGLLFMLVRNSFDQMVGSHIAARFADRQYAAMIGIVRKTGLIGGALCLPLLVVIVAFPHWLLGLFGPGFVRGAPALVILGIGQFLAVAVGPIGTVLTMAHREHVAMRIEFGVTALTITLFLILIPLYALTGAAIAISLAILGRAGALLVANRAFIRDMERQAHAA